MTGAWQIWIDRGGTFTDLVALRPDGALAIRKILSSESVTADDPMFAALQELLDGVADTTIEVLKVGTTVTTNALLERRGARVALLTTRGFGDSLVIGSQHRPDIFALNIERPAPWYETVVEVDERLDVHGEVIKALDPDLVSCQLRSLRDAGIESLAIALLHGWQHRKHEAIIAQLARSLGFADVSVSHELLPQPRWVSRANTTVVNAYLAPRLAAYVESLRRSVERLPGSPRLHFMQSSGGLTSAEHFRALASLVSGPAGGLVAMSRLGEMLGERQLIGFDMGGTSTDVSLLDGELPRAWQRDIAGAQIAFPQLDIHTIAAGGGSIVQWRDGRLCVGPESAAARPGPAAYGRGGPATLTDVQLVLGRLQPQFLPAIFGADNRQTVDLPAARAALQQLCRPGENAEDLAAAAFTVGVEAMANAIRHVSTARGLDAGDFTLFAFGGAAGQHACAVAESSGMRRVLLHPLASVLSACGIGIADWLVVEREGNPNALDEKGLDRARAGLRRLRDRAIKALQLQNLGHGSIDTREIVELRLGHSETRIDVPSGSLEAMRAEFRNQWKRQFGYEAGAGMDAALTIDALRIEARLRPTLPALGLVADSSQPPKLPRSARLWRGTWVDTPVLAVTDLTSEVAGPALLVSPHTTLVLESGWSARRLQDGSVLAIQAAAGPQTTRLTAVGAERLELFNSLFMHIATEMGIVLQRTAQSVNIKERLDYSCAVFDGEGRLIANAPHMPVHLGSMGASVRAVIERHGTTMQPGDAWLLNSPYSGGTHLPDMTVISPVFVRPEPGSAGGDTANRRADFFVASRAHHADIGGISPGSMPAFSRQIGEEGALFADFQLLAGGRRDESGLRSRLLAGPWPARNIEQNLADLDAQLAANTRGAEELTRAAERHGVQALQAAMHAVIANAAECVRGVIDTLADGAATVEFDNGCRVAVRITVDRKARRAGIDFTGSSAQGQHNFHAPRAVTVAAVLYVFRTLIDRDIPLNEGCLEPLDLIIPPASLLDPEPPGAVVAGNVETSQCIVDALYLALGRLACSQGTMNNLSFGNEALQYYETIAGGAGASTTASGCDAVQTHMTNSRLTDPEIFEARFPVRVLEFSIRRDSGGIGRHRGGHGAVRRLEFLAPLQGAILANRRRTVPQGLAGGQAGATGVTRIVRSHGAIETLAACAEFKLLPGDVLEILTPGGGGFGRTDP